MTHALKAALLSGLVFPGLGHFLLRHYKRGIALSGATAVSLVILVIKAVQTALAVLVEMASRGAAVYMEQISQAARDAAAGKDSVIVNAMLLVILACWLAGLVDAVRMGRKKDAAPPPDEPG